MKCPRLRAAWLCAALFPAVLTAPFAAADLPSKRKPSPSAPGTPSTKKIQSAVSPDKSASAGTKVEAVPTPAAPDRHLTRGQYLARTALAYRGARYRFGGTSPKSGFDCSGLVQAVCAKWGIMLPRVARAQYKLGVPVSPEQLQAGDLVFFKNTYRRGLSHVGIYVGEGFFIHAATERKGVILSSLTEGYHKKHWAGARRLDLSKLPTSPEETLSSDKVYLEDAAGKIVPAMPEPSPAPDNE